MQHCVQEPNSGLSGREDLEGGLIFYTEPPEPGNADDSQSRSDPCYLALQYGQNLEVSLLA